MAVGAPHVFDGDEDGRVIGPAHGREDACHAVFAVFLSRRGGDAVHGAEGVADAEACPFRGLAADDGFAASLKGPAFGDAEPRAGSFIRRVGEDLFFRPGDAKSPVVIAKGKRNDQIGFPALPEFFHFSVGDIPDGMIPKEDRIDDELVRRAFRAGEDGKGLHCPVQSVVEARGHLDEEDRESTRRGEDEEQERVPRGTAQQGETGQTQDHSAASFLR